MEEGFAEPAKLVPKLTSYNLFLFSKKNCITRKTPRALCQARGGR
jgi:hypothetical protein